MGNGASAAHGLTPEELEAFATGTTCKNNALQLLGLGESFAGSTWMCESLTPRRALCHRMCCCAVDKKQLQRLWKRFNLLDRTGSGKITR